MPDPAGAVFLLPGDQAFLDVDPRPGDEAVLVRYAAGRPGQLQPETRFVNEAMPWTATQPVISGTCSDRLWRPSGELWERSGDYLRLGRFKIEVQHPQASERYRKVK